MSYYVYGSSLSWSDYLQAKGFVDDISSSSHEAGRRVSMEISRQTREVIASKEALARENIRMIETSTDRITGGLADVDSTLNAGFDRINSGLADIDSTLNIGFDRLSYHLQNISSGISGLNATFHWGFGQLIAGIGHMNDVLSELLEIAKTPVQTIAFNHFKIARDAFRQSLLQEALEELQKAIQGDHTSPGYKLEWRFHQIVGIIRLGFVNGDLSLVNLASAEESFLLAARYAKTDYPEDAARAFLSAGWAAYCQGKMKEAIAHTEQALLLHPKLSEALFQAAKVRMALGEVDKALPVLGKAIELDRFFALKAAGDGDFKKYDDQLREFLEAMRMEKYQSLAEKVETSLKAAEPLLSRIVPEDQALARQMFLRKFLNNKKMPLMDLMNLANEIHKNVAELDALNVRWNEIERQRPAAHQNVVSILKTFSFWADHSADAKPLKEYLSESMNWPMTKLYDFYKNIEEFFDHAKKKASMSTFVLCGKPFDAEITIQMRSLFRNSGVRTVKMIKDEVYSGKGEQLASIEFCLIPAGQFMMGEKDSQQLMTIVKDFYLGKYPVTQAQWQAVMHNNNPSHFEGDPSLPVEHVDWNDCQQFLNKLNEIVGKKLYRLPTEAEWEYACRAGSTGHYCYGNGDNKLHEYGWYSVGKTYPVGQLKPNAWGLHDMHGNVWERINLYVLRGGSWNSHPETIRCTSRRDLRYPGYNVKGIGFRLARAQS